MNIGQVGWERQNNGVVPFPWPPNQPTDERLVISDYTRQHRARTFHTPN